MEEIIAIITWAGFTAFIFAGLCFIYPMAGIAFVAISVIFSSLIISKIL